MSEHIYRIDLGGGPLTLDTSVERYGLEQRFTPDEDHLGWHGGWPAYTNRAHVEALRQENEDVRKRNTCPCGGCLRRWEFRVRVYRPEPPAFYWRMEQG